MVTALCVVFNALVTCAMSCALVEARATSSRFTSLLYMHDKIIVFCVTVCEMREKMIVKGHRYYPQAFDHIILDITDG